MNRARVLAGVLLTLASAPLAACTNSPQPTMPAAPASAAEAESNTPSTHTVATRDVTVKYRLNGRTVASDAVGIPTHENTVLTLASPVGSTVTAGKPLGTVSPEPAALAALTSAATSSTVAASRLHALQARSASLTAPVTGQIRQDGGATSVVSPGIDALVDLTPLQFLRYQGFEFAGLATVETVFGQQRVPCQGIWLTNAPSAAAPDPATAASGNAPTTGQLHCRLPADVETAPGLPLSVQLTAETVKAAVAVPSIYVGLDASGAHYAVKVRQADGTFKETPVVVGPTDGVLRIITSGLKAGDVLQPRTEGS